jgi:hypothetical protein
MTMQLYLKSLIALGVAIAVGLCTYDLIRALLDWTWPP